MKRKALVVGLMIAFAWPLGSSAVWSDDPAENNQLTDAGGAQHSPVIVSDGSDGAYVAWVDDAAGNSDISVQYINADGDKQWTADGVVVAETANNETDPQLVANADGGVYVVWESDVDSGNIYAQRLSSTGTKLWATNGRSVAVGEWIQTTPRATANPAYPDGTRGFVVAYRRQERPTTLNEVYAARFSHGGELRKRRRLDFGTPNLFSRNALLYRGSSDYVYVRTLDAALIGSPETVNVTETPARKTLAEPYHSYVNTPPEMPYSGLVFYSSLDGVTKVRLRRFGMSPSWPTAGYAIASTGNAQTHPKLVQYGTSIKSEIITWVDGASNQQNIRAQRIFRKDRMWGAGGIVVSNAGNNQHSQEMIPSDDGGALVAWIDERSSANGDLYAQRIELDGTMSWQANGIPVSTRGGVQASLTIIPSGDGLIAVWADGTGDNRDIYVQMVNGDGTL